MKIKEIFPNSTYNRTNTYNRNLRVNGSHDFFLFSILIFIYFSKYETIETHAHAFLTLILLAIAGVYGDIEGGFQESRSRKWEESRYSFACLRLWSNNINFVYLKLDYFYIKMTKFKVLHFFLKNWSHKKMSTLKVVILIQNDFWHSELFWFSHSSISKNVKISFEF